MTNITSFILRISIQQFDIGRKLIMQISVNWDLKLYPKVHWQDKLKN